MDKENLEMLHRLKKQVDGAISLLEAGMLIKAESYLPKHCLFIVGDFAIYPRDRKKPEKPQ